MPETLRSFVAVEISPNVRARASQLIRSLSTAGAKVTWVEPQNLHLTLVFLGEIQLLDVPELLKALQRAVESLPPFDLEVRGAGAFPDAKRPRTLWLGVQRGAEEMIVLHDAVQSELADLGYRTEGRRYRPHLTLGRVRQPPRDSSALIGLLQEQSDFFADVMSVADVTLFSSQLTKEGPQYDSLGEVELGGT